MYSHLPTILDFCLQGLMSFSEVESLPIAFPLLDEKQLTASLKSEIKSRPHSRVKII
mgnify:FL=1